MNEASRNGDGVILTSLMHSPALKVHAKAEEAFNNVSTNTPVYAKLIKYRNGVSTYRVLWPTPFPSITE